MKTTFLFCIFATAFWAAKPNLATSKQQVNTIVTDTVKIDPVCNMKVKATTKFKSNQGKNTYLFCNKSCKTAFDAKPEKYIKK